MSVRDLFASVRRHRGVALVVFSICIALGAAAAFLPEPTYRADATLFVQPKPGGTSDSFGAVEAARFLQPALAALVETESFKAGVRGRVPPAVSRARVALSGAPEVGTPILRVSAETKDLDAAEGWANAAAEELIAKNPSPLVDISVIDPARRPGSPSGPVRVPILLGSWILGLILMVFTALGVDGMRRRFRSAEELRDMLGVEVLGEIPRVRSFPDHPSQVMDLGTNPPLLEAYQRLRTNFELLLLSKQPRSVVITSYGLGEGKTTVSTNLAWGVAALGQEIVVVDGDLRRPRVHTALNVDGRQGLAEMNPGDDVVALQQPTGMPGLTVIPAGVTSRHPTELIASTFPRLLGTLEASHRFTIVDAPPLIVADAVLLAAMTRSVVLVVDVSQRDPDDIRRAISELRQAGADVLGVVLNRSRRRQSRRGSEYYYHRVPNQSRRPWRRETVVPAEAEVLPPPTPPSPPGR